MPPSLLQLPVVHGGLSSFGRDVDDDHDVAPVLLQVHHVAVDILSAEGVHVLGLSIDNYDIVKKFSLLTSNIIKIGHILKL